MNYRTKNVNNPLTARSRETVLVRGATLDRLHRQSRKCLRRNNITNLVTNILDGITDVADNLTNEAKDLVENANDRLQDGEDSETAPALLNTELAGLLPEVVIEGEEDGAVTSLVGNGEQGSDLLDGAGDGKAVGVTTVGPTSLQVDSRRIQGRADTGQEVELLLDEATGVERADLGVEEGVNIATNNGDSTAENAAVLLPDVQRLSGGDMASVSALLEGRLGRGDESGERVDVNPTVHEGLVTDDNQVDNVPLGPLDEGINLGLSSGDAGLVDVDTDDKLQTDSLSGNTDVLEAVAVSGVDTNSVEATGLDLSNVLLDVALALALAIAGVRRVGDTVALATLDLAVVVSSAGLSGRNALGRGGSRSRDRSRGVDRGRGRGDGGGGRSAAGQTGAEGADVGVVLVGDSHGLLGLGVGAGGERGRRGVDQDGARRDVGGDGGDGVGASGRADVGGLLYDAGHGAARGLDGGHGAGDGGGSLNDGGDTTNGVGTAGDGSRGRSADGGLAGHSDGPGRDGVGARGREGGDGGRRESRGRGRARGRSRGRGGHNAHGAVGSRRDGGRDLLGDGRARAARAWAGAVAGGARAGLNGGNGGGARDGDHCICQCLYTLFQTCPHSLSHKILSMLRLTRPPLTIDQRSARNTHRLETRSR